MVKTDSKTITGKIIHVSQSIARSTSWGGTLFKGQEVIVDVRCKQKKNAHVHTCGFFFRSSWNHEQSSTQKMATDDSRRTNDQQQRGSGYRQSRSLRTYNKRCGT